MPKVVTGSGISSPRDWQAYVGAGGPGIYVDVDTTDADFPNTPVYVCSLHGNSEHWATTGGSSIYSPTATRFRVYVRRQNGASLTPNDADALGWYIAWIGQYFFMPFPEGPDPEL
jgi:hypothetical protein